MPQIKHSKRKKEREWNPVISISRIADFFDFERSEKASVAMITLLFLTILPWRKTNLKVFLSRQKLIENAINGDFLKTVLPNYISF